MSVELGNRLQSIRKRSGLSQKELATESGVSISLIRKIEQGERTDVRLETLRKLAVGLRVRTSDLQTRDDTENADPDTRELWEPTRRALVGQIEGPEIPASPAEVEARLRSLRPMLGENRYTDVAAVLPGLIRDGDSLEDGRALRSRILNLAGWMLTQTRQFEDAEAALARAVDSADDRNDAAAAVDTLLWTLLRQGRLDEARSLAIRWADDVEPRISRATHRELSIWARLYTRVANAAVRDNQPGEAQDALSFARAAAQLVGREVYADRSTMKTFGPISVAHICAESHAIAERPDKVLAIAESTPAAALEPTAANRLRHRLDVASAHTQLGQLPEAIGVIQEVRVLAPEWLPQQRYARDILSTVICKRRTLTEEMRELADFVMLEY
ncbi:helix-turn-helix transcriptional regulator [Nocardia sp. NPDC050697]|uniref:helix-turn-helix domain-containing protein n=1 Tax=Nocardia sp. NPDC050697 TaxID=3155158 RepID=UPI0033F561D6